MGTKTVKILLALMLLLSITSFFILLQTFPSLTAGQKRILPILCGFFSGLTLNLLVKENGDSLETIIYSGVITSALLWLISLLVYSKIALLFGIGAAVSTLPIIAWFLIFKTNKTP